MATSLALMSKLASMLIMVIIGIIIVRIGLVRSEDARPLSAIVVYVLQPALIINAMQLDLSAERIRGFLFGVIFCTLTYCLWISVCHLLKKPLRLSPVDIDTIIYSNAGNLTLPVVAMVMGSEMLFYVSALQIPFNLFVWSHGQMIISGDKHFSLKKILLNTNIIALFIGLILTAFHIELPDIIATTVSSLNAAVASIAMIVIGMVIGHHPLKELFMIKKAYPILAGRLIIFPLITMLILYATGIMQAHPEFVPVALALFVGLSAPPASNISQLAVLYDEEPFTASAYNTIGCFLCILTIPLVLLIYQMLF